MRNSKTEFADHFAKIHEVVLPHFGIQLQKLLMQAIFQSVKLLIHQI